MDHWHTLEQNMLLLLLLVLVVVEKHKLMTFV